MRQPDFLVPGDKIGIVAPARKVSREELRQGLEILAGWGYVPVESQNLYGSCNQFSGTDEERASDLQSMINDKSIKAIIAVRGGYGCMRIIDNLDLSALDKNPKWLCGFSDMTVFHSHLHMNHRLQTLHSIMVFNMNGERFDRVSVETLGKALSGVKLCYEYNPSSELIALQRKGTVTAEVVGGNLSMIYALSGSKSDIDTKGKILFIEDLDEYLYHIDRMMIQLKRSGKLHQLAGLVVGGMNEMKDNTVPFGKSAETTISDEVSEYNYPVAFGFPAGHQFDNRSLIFGAKASLTVNDTVKLEYI